MPTPAEILEQLKAITYPGFSRDIVSFGLIKDIEVSSGEITVVLSLTTDNEDIIRQIHDGVMAAVESMPDVTVPVRVARDAPPQAQQPRGPQPIEGVKKIIAVASGKGGVGKSTVASNLALALANHEARVGLMDTDVYGPSIPAMFGITDKLRRGEGASLEPIERHGIRVMSMGLLVQDSTPIIWRGPMLTKLVTEFIRNCTWGELDTLVLDLPPGTGDVQLTLTQRLAIDGGVIVTTPQDVALADVRRGVQMFAQMGAPVLGVVENMSLHVCSECGHESTPFGHGGAEKLAAEVGIPILGQLPLVRQVREAGDEGVPIVAAEPSHPSSRAYGELAERVIVRVRETASSAAQPAAS